MSPDAKLEKAVNDSLFKVNPAIKVRPKQLAAIKSILSGTDTLAILPTSYGKSMIFRLLPAVCKALDSHPNNAIVIVIAPLISIVVDQVEAANNLNSSLGLNACSICLTEYENIRNLKYNILVGTPEAWLDSERWEGVISSEVFRQRLVCIVVDEVHQVSWGYNDTLTGEAAFREAFSRIGTLRSFCCENVPVLALSATVTRDYCELISMSCSLSNNLKLIVTCSDRPNIRLSYVKCPEKNINCFSWVIKKLKELGNKCPKMMIYCRSQLLVGWLYEQFFIQLKLKMFKDGSKGTKNALLAMYHADTLDYIKNHIVEELTCDSSTLRVVICTSALGCGVDCKNVKYIFHFGPPHNLIDYCQQIGRAGRGNESDCHAILYHFPGCLTKLVSADMKLYMKTTSCLRTALFSPFNETEISQKHPLHQCCINCAKSCSCGSEECINSFPFESLSNDSTTEESDSDVIPHKRVRTGGDAVEKSPQYEFEDSEDDLNDFNEDLEPE